MHYTIVHYTNSKKAINNNESLLINSNVLHLYKWQSFWNIQKTKLNEIKNNIYRWTNPKVNRKENTVLNRLCIGHTRITHGFLMAGEKPPPFAKQKVSFCIIYNDQSIILCKLIYLLIWF